jgi:iron complex transport system permease protein
MTVARYRPDWLLSSAAWPWLVLGAMLVVLAVCMLVATCVGAMSIPASETLMIIAGALGLTLSEPSASASVVLHLRLPRVLLAALVGAVLGLAGAASQGLFRNPLAEPGLIGISSGSVLAVVLTVVVGGNALAGAWSGFFLAFAAFVGALLTAQLVQALSAARGGASTASLIMAGVAISAFSFAMVGIMFAFASDAQLRSITFWNLGSLGAASWASLGMVAVPIGLACAMMLRKSQVLNALQLGDAEAAHLGIHVQAEKRAIILWISLGVGAAVSLTGIIGFIGLVVPHLVRLSLGANHRHVLPASAIAGATLLVAADLAARTLAAPAELPVGALTALLGTPFFLWLLLKREVQSLS